MANLSDRAQTEQDAPSSWIDALARTEGFVPLFEGSDASACAREQQATPDETNAEGETNRAPSEEFLAGEAAGRAAALAQIAAEAERQRKLKLRFAELDAQAIECLARELARTVCALCEKLLGDFAHDPRALQRRCEEAAKRIGQSPRALALHLNPDDVDRLDRDFVDSWRIVADETIEAGGLRLEGPDGAIADGPAEWRRAIEKAVRA